jgi:hypothetical protein
MKEKQCTSVEKDIGEHRGEARRKRTRRDIKKAKLNYKPARICQERVWTGQPFAEEKDTKLDYF